jgi:hypothetical protein
MKIEQLIVQFLYKKKKVKLQSIGEFTFVSDSNAEDSDNATIFFPEESINFKFDPKTTQDDDLIQYIMSQTGKIKPLAASDLESYIVLSKQFLNIGKTLFLNELGSILKNQNNEYLFTQGVSVPIILDTNSPQKVESNQKDKIISFASPVRKKSNTKFIFFIAILIVIFSSISIIYYFISTNKNKEENLLSPVIDSTAYYDNINSILKNYETNTKKRTNKNDSTNLSSQDSLISSSDSGSTRLSDTTKRMK